MQVWPAESADMKLVHQLEMTFDVDTQRTLSQEVTFAMNQLVEVAVRALSPSLNDPFTATQCLDWLGEALSRLANRKFPSPYRADQAGKLRLIAHPISFAILTDTAFGMIRQNSARSAAVMLRMLETICHILLHTCRPEDRLVLLEHAEMVYKQAHEQLSAATDLRMLEERHQAVLDASKS